MQRVSEAVINYYESWVEEMGLFYPIFTTSFLILILTILLIKPLRKWVLKTFF